MVQKYTGITIYARRSAIYVCVCACVSLWFMCYVGALVSRKGRSHFQEMILKEMNGCWFVKSSYQTQPKLQTGWLSTKVSVEVKWFISLSPQLCHIVLSIQMYHTALAQTKLFLLLLSFYERILDYHTVLSVTKNHSDCRFGECVCVCVGVLIIVYLKIFW